MSEYSYNDGLCNGGRSPLLWVVHAGRIHKFVGRHIDAVLAITGTEYRKNGKWSNTTYQLQLAPGAVACRLLAQLHGRVWPENFRAAAYDRFVTEFSVTVGFEEFDIALERDFPESRARMLQGEAALEALETSQESDEVELVTISTSKPYARTPHSDVRVSAPDGGSWVVAHEAPAGTSVAGVFQLVEKRHTPGPKGGMSHLTFALAGGAKVAVEHYPKDGAAHAWALGRAGDGTPKAAAGQPQLPTEGNPAPTTAPTGEQMATLFARFGAGDHGKK